MDTFTGREYLLIDIANCYGFDRLSWEARIQWAESQLHDLADLADTAKSPVLFRKAARAIQLVDTGRPTNHIMGLDATASGIQIMAAMSGCWKTASEVNLVDPDTRKDLYSSISTYMNKLIGVEQYQRNDLKDPIMTTFYGSTAQPKKIFGEGTIELQAFYKVLNERLPGAVRVLKVIQQFWDPTVTHHEWTLPDGHTAFVPVVGTDEKNLEIDELDHLRMAYRTQVLGTRTQSRALAANVVHSVDAWVCRQMIIMAQNQGFWLAPIHDCFYASPKYMNQVRRNYRVLLAWIADENVLENILRNISKSPVSIRKASNNLSEAILRSSYALS